MNNIQETVREIEKKKEELADNILELIREFEDSTNLYVGDIGILRANEFGGESYIVGMNITVLVGR